MATPMMKSLKMSGYSVDLAIFVEANMALLRENQFLENIYKIGSIWEFREFYKKYDYLIATAGVNPWKVRIINIFLVGAKKFFAKRQKRDIHRIDMNLEIASPLLTKSTREPYIFLNRTIQCGKYLVESKKNIALAVGSGSKQKFKRWSGFRDLAKRLKDSANIIILLGSDEVELESEFRDLGLKIVKEPLESVVALISKVDLLVGNDNGLMHIGYALGVNTVTIFGMTNPKETGSYRDNSSNVYLEDLDCRPCFDPSNDKIGCRSLECLNDISTQMVLSVCQKYL